MKRLSRVDSETALAVLATPTAVVGEQIGVHAAGHGGEHDGDCAGQTGIGRTWTRASTISGCTISFKKLMTSEAWMSPAKP